MSFLGLQDSLRKELRKRIDGGELTGIELARRTGFTQAHISNFLNRKRGLKLSALDRMLKAFGLSVYDLLNPHDLGQFAAAADFPGNDEVEVPLVDCAAAALSEVIVQHQVQEMIKLRKSVVDRLRPDLVSAERKSWTRFVMIRAEAKEAAALAPRLSAGCLLLLDRHYTTLRPARRDERNLYAVRHGEDCLLRYIETSGKYLVLRPHNTDVPSDVLPHRADEDPANFIIGRIAMAQIEL